jgi:hypothetical protein
MTSKVPALIDYLVTAFQGSGALAAMTLGDTTGVTVYDGPATTGLDAKLKLFVGLDDPDSDQAQSAAAFTQSFNGLDASKRDEMPSVNCVAEAWAGTDDARTVRVAVFAIVTTVETIIRAVTDQFGGNASLAFPGVTAGELLQNNTTTGAVARVRFQVQFRSLNA